MSAAWLEGAVSSYILNPSNGGQLAMNLKYTVIRSSGFEVYSDVSNLKYILKF